MADVNAIQFSSMPLHRLSGMSQFPFRDGYDPSLQRWIQRDPMGEAGGLNLFRFNFNNPLSFIDPDGSAPQLVSVTGVVGVGVTSVGYADYNFGQDYGIGLHGPLASPVPGLVVGSMVPGVGEAMDLWVLGDPHSKWWEKALSAGSLGLNALTDGLLPNIGGFLKAGKTVCRDAAEATASRAPIFADANVLVNAFKGNANALAEIRAGTTYVTPNQFREFLNVNEVAARRAFLETEGVQLFAGSQAGQIASTATFQQTFGAIVGAQGRGDAALAAFAKSTGYEAVTMERRLFNYIKYTVKDPSIPIRRITP
jgi:RHS repeat-associated protein